MTRKVIKKLDAMLATYEIADRIGKDDVDAANRFVDAVETSCAFLAEFPDSGEVLRIRHKRLKGLRAWPVKGYRNYLILFLAKDETVEILAVVHGARNLRHVVRDL